jgi:hypothetical protein
VSTWEPDEDATMLELAEDTVPSLVALVRRGTTQHHRCPPTFAHHVTAAWVLSSLARVSLRLQELIRLAGGLLPLTQLLRQPDGRALAAAAAALANLLPGNAANQVHRRQSSANRDALGISGGRALTGPFRDARRFPSTRWYPVPGATRTPLGFGICLPVVQGPFSVAPLPSPEFRFATFASV